MKLINCFHNGERAVNNYTRKKSGVRAFEPLSHSILFFFWWNANANENRKTLDKKKMAREIGEKNRSQRNKNKKKKKKPFRNQNI